MADDDACPSCAAASDSAARAYPRAGCSSLGRLRPDPTADAGARGVRDAGNDCMRAPLNPSASPERMPRRPVDEDNPESRQQMRAAGVPARRCGRGRAADCVREYREPAACEGHAPGGAGRAPRHRREPRTARAATADRERAAVARRRHLRARPGVGGRAGVPGLAAAGRMRFPSRLPSRSIDVLLALLDCALARHGPCVGCCAGAEVVAARLGPGAEGGVQGERRRRTSIRRPKLLVVGEVALAVAAADSGGTLRSQPAGGARASIPGSTRRSWCPHRSTSICCATQTNRDANSIRRSSQTSSACRASSRPRLRASPS